MDERRQLPRWEVGKEARVWMPLTQSFGHCRIEDIHLKGMCVSFEKELPAENPLRMSFAIGEDFDFVKVEANIPWKKEEQGRHIYGLSFSKIHDSDKDKIYQFISANCSDQLREKWWGA